MNKIIIYTDGGARGNPGPAGIGVIINGKPYYEYIGCNTNNKAEYQAVVFALKKTKAILGARRINFDIPIEIYLDSELVCNQLNGTFKITDESLWPYFMNIWNLRRDLKNVSFHLIPREQNKEADKLVNKALDEHLSIATSLF